MGLAEKSCATRPAYRTSSDAPPCLRALHAIVPCRRRRSSSTPSCLSGPSHHATLPWSSSPPSHLPSPPGCNHIMPPCTLAGLPFPLLDCRRRHSNVAPILPSTAVGPLFTDPCQIMTPPSLYFLFRSNYD